MKMCSRCKQQKREEDFNFKKKALGIRQKACRECTRKEVRTHYQKNKNYYLEKSRIRNRRQRTLIQEYIYTFLSQNPCIDCGEKDPVVLEFDHKSDKLDCVSRLIKRNGSLTQIKKEILKCQVRCANCHRRKTAKEFGWYKYTMRP